ncbi:MAG TPA: FAD/NAD(P)-binding protein [Sedimentisphaerales bacterium]|nr:FAD/NAD(P)-binding protein [Sedimentisphaerales bacterium]
MDTSAVSQTDDNKSKHELYRPFTCKIESVRDLTLTEKLFKLVRPDGQPFGHKPGQFMQVSVTGIGEAPISVSSSPTRGQFLELGVRKAGKLTGAMHELKSGDMIGLRGPFGTSFDTEAMKGKDLLLISGGCGLAPMRALIQYVEDCRDDFGEVTVLYGAKSPDDILYKDELIGWQSSDKLVCQFTVDSIPQGTCWDANVGLITQLIPPLQIDVPKTVAVIVGPPIMYRFVIRELNSKGVSDENIIVSLERYMKCGVGKCGHCTIDHLYCCIDGPVFRLEDVAGLKGAI